MEENILKHTLQNSIKYQGNPNPKAILGKILSENPQQKKNIQEIKKQIEKTIQKIKKLTLQEQKTLLQQKAPELLQKQKKQEPKLKELEGAETGKVITRIPPEPSKHLHIGHALSFIINYTYAQKYQGQTKLRFEDTNPTLSKQEYEDSIKEDLKYLDIKTTETKHTSDDIQQMQKECKKLIEKKQAYICSCDKDTMAKLKQLGNQCKCHNETTTKQIEEFEKMKQGQYQEGTKTIRLKANMQSKNYSMRDPIIFRITKTPHYKQKNKHNLWPLYDFANAYEDGKQQITHIMRSIEFGTMKTEVQNLIKKYLNLPQQKIIQYGRFIIPETTTKGREIRQLIETKQITNWDDPKLATIKTLKRRGIQKETLYQIAKQAGLSKTQTKIDWQLISSINRKILDKKAKRLLFIQNPQKITIKNAPEKKLQLKTHPENEKPDRELETNQNFYIQKENIQENQIYRLIDHINITKKNNQYQYHSEDLETYRKQGKGTILWLPQNQNNTKVEILMDNGNKITGIAEPKLKQIKKGEIIQFIKHGFYKVENTNQNKHELIYCHD